MEKSKKQTILAYIDKIKTDFLNDKDLVMLIDKKQNIYNSVDKNDMEIYSILKNLKELSDQVDKNIDIIDFLKTMYILIQEPLNIFYKVEDNIIKEKIDERLKRLSLILNKYKIYFDNLRLTRIVILNMIDLISDVLVIETIIEFMRKTIESYREQSKNQNETINSCRGLKNKKQQLLQTSDISDEMRAELVGQIKIFEETIKKYEEINEKREEEINKYIKLIKELSNEMEKLTEKIKEEKKESTQMIDEIRKFINKIQSNLLLWIGEIEGYYALIPFENENTIQIQILLSETKKSLGLPSEDSIGEDSKDNGNSLKKVKYTLSNMFYRLL